MNQKIFKIALAKEGLTAVALARLLGIHHSILSLWVNGHYPVPEKHREPLARALNVTQAELFTDNKEE